jgi:hypothetical protein
MNAVPEYHKPVIGLAMYHLMRGQTADWITERIRTSRSLGNLTYTEIASCIERAQINVAATRRIQSYLQSQREGHKPNEDHRFL